MFPNTSIEVDDFFNTRSVNSGLQREDLLEKVLSGFSNTITNWEGQVFKHKFS